MKFILNVFYYVPICFRITKNSHLVYWKYLVQYTLISTKLCSYYWILEIFLKMFYNHINRIFYFTILEYTSTLEICSNYNSLFQLPDRVIKTVILKYFNNNLIIVINNNVKDLNRRTYILMCITRLLNSVVFASYEHCNIIISSFVYPIL